MNYCNRLSVKGGINLKKTKLVILLLIVFIFSMYYSPTKSYACSCVEPGPVQEELNRSSVVFSGKVIDVLDVNKNNAIQSSADPISVLFEVEEVWKGLDQTQVIVTTERDSASCGYEFALNGEYLVYAQERDGELTASLCSRTTPLASATTDLDELGFGEQPSKQVLIDLSDKKIEEKGSTDILGSSNLVYFILLIVGLIIIVGYIIRRNKTRK